MSQVVPDTESFLFSDSEEETYSSIDDSPQIVIPDDKDLSHRLFERNNQCLQQSMKFRLGTIVTAPPEVTSPLPDLVPTRFPPESLAALTSQEEPDQMVPDLSTSKSWVIPDNLIKPISPNSGRGFYFQNSLIGNNSFHRTKPTNNLPIEWRSTKLPADKSEALKKALLCFLQCCHDKVCEKGKNLLEETKKRIQTSRKVDSDDRQILEYLLEHFRDCAEYFCIAPGCNQLQSAKLGELIECINKDDHYKELRYSPNAEFFSFSSNCWVKCPQDVIDTTMYHVSTSPSSISIYHNNSKWTKVAVLGDIMQDILPLLKTIGRLSNHPNILPIDWLIDDQTIHYSTEHYAEPLKYKFKIIDMDKKTNHFTIN